MWAWLVRWVGVDMGGGDRRNAQGGVRAEVGGIRTRIKGAHQEGGRSRARIPEGKVTCVFGFTAK